MRRFKIFHRLVPERNIPGESGIHSPHEHERLIIHAHNRVQQILVTRASHHIPNILTHQSSPLGVPTRRPRLRQMIRQLLGGIIGNNLLGERKLTIKMILKRILRRLPRRRPSPRPHLLRRPPEPRPRRRHIPRPLPILGPLLIIPTRLIHVGGHMPPRDRRPTDPGIKTNRLGIIELREPLKRSSRLRGSHTPHTPTRHTRITLSPTQIHTGHLPTHIRQRPAQTIRPPGDSRQLSSRAPILPTHSIT